MIELVGDALGQMVEFRGERSVRAEYPDGVRDMREVVGRRYKAVLGRKEKLPSLVLIDLDHVAESNINRQVLALDATLGQAKVLAMKERVAQINPACKVHIVEAFVEPDNWPALLPGEVDAVIDACDQVKAKVAMAAWARTTDTFFITVAFFASLGLPPDVRAEQIAPDAFVLEPYGRFMNAFKFAGETDVWEALDDADREKLAKKNLGEFSLEDFRDQLKQLRKLGPLESLLGMLPGAGVSKPNGLPESPAARISTMNAIDAPFGPPKGT